jgi:hypothetical protein
MSLIFVYKALALEGIDQPSIRGWESIWKLKFQVNTKEFMWIVLNNRALPWDILQKIYLEGLGRCCLCEANIETNSHLIFSCPLSKQVWKEFEGINGLQNLCQGVSIEEGLKIYMLE